MAQPTKAETEDFVITWDQERRIIRVTFTRQQTKDIALAFRDAIGALWEGTPGFRDSALILESSASTSFPKEVRDIHKEGNDTHPFPLVAVVGLGTLLRTVITFVGFAIGRSDTLQVFQTEEEAIKWIESKQQTTDATETQKEEEEQEG
jgi:hypothetical protein